MTKKLFLKDNTLVLRDEEEKFSEEEPNSKKRKKI